MTENKQTGDGFGWSDKVDVPDSKFSLLPKGEAFFTVTKIERQRKEYGSFGVQNVAVISFMCTPVEGEGDGEIEVQFGLVKKLGWKILQLATACGFREHGDSNEIDPRWWAKFEGASGRCMIDHREGKKKKSDGSAAMFNEIAEFLAPEAEVKKPDNLEY